MILAYFSSIIGWKIATLRKLIPPKWTHLAEVKSHQNTQNFLDEFSGFSGLEKHDEGQHMGLWPSKWDFSVSNNISLPLHTKIPGFLGMS